MNIGQFNTLKIRSKSPYGLVLETDSDPDLILPKTEAPPYAKEGDELTVFIYTDGDGDPIATLEKPLVTPGNTALLNIVSNTDAGTWLDWGLSQDLLLPRSEHRKHRKPDHPKSTQIFVYVFLDETGKISATTRLHRHFDEDGTHYKAGQKVDIVIADKTELGFKAIINNELLGLLFEDQTHREPQIGEQLEAHVKRVRHDGKVDLTLYATTAHQSSDLEQRIIKLLNQSGGASNLTDKSSPEEIYAAFQVSKKHFKRAIGSLYKAQKIVIEKNQITLVTSAGSK